MINTDLAHLLLSFSPSVRQMEEQCSEFTSYLDRLKENDIQMIEPTFHVYLQIQDLAPCPKITHKFWKPT